MAATIVELANVTSELGICFKTKEQVYLYLNAYSNGIASISFSEFTSIPNAIKTVVGLFDKKSNLYGFKEVKFILNKLEFEVTEPNANYDLLIQEYFRKSNS